MTTLYGRARTGSFAPCLALVAAGAPFDYVAVDETRGEQATPRFLALNPKGRIPVLVLDSGAVLTESAAMMLHIAEMHPEAGLLPPPGADGRTRVLRWLFFAVCELYETSLRFAYPDRYTADPAGTDAVREAARAQRNAAFAILEAAYAETEGPYLLGDRLTVADLYLPMFLTWHDDTPALLARSPNLVAMARSVRARPSLGDVFAAQGLSEFGGP